MVYNKLHPHEDYTHGEVVMVEDPDKIIELGIKYFSEDLEKLYYPAKSFSVAIIYAYLIQKHFGEDFYASLNDPDLLCGNDQYFLPYDSAPHVYNAIISALEINSSEFTLNVSIEQVSKTVNFFYAEFGLN